MNKILDIEKSITAANGNISLAKELFTMLLDDLDRLETENGKLEEYQTSYYKADKEAAILRDVDILVEYKYAGHNFCFIVECRDRSRSETVEWIDGLVGKTKSLNVNKVIAVSSKGFAAAAKRKAKEAEKSATELQLLVAAGQDAASELSFDEASTRRYLVETMLVAAGWDVGAAGKSTYESLISKHM